MIDGATGVLHYTTVLVPLDGSEFAAAALRTAGALATRFGAELLAISVAGDDGEVEHLREQAAGNEGLDPDRITVVVDDDPAAAIERQRDALGDCLLCMSTHGRGRVGGAVIGSVARSLLQRSPDPIVVVGPLADRPEWASSDLPPPLSVPRLVACVDGSRQSEAVVQVAAGWADALGMELCIVTVAEPVPAPVRPGGAWNRRFGPEGDAEEYIADVTTRWANAAENVSGEVVYDAISPAEGVGSHLHSRPAGLVAVTTHARSGLRRLILGAQAAAIVRSSVVPTVVVPLPTVADD